MNPTSIYHYPVYDKFSLDRKVVALFINIVGWNIFLENTLSDPDEELICVIKNECAGQEITYLINGPETTYLGKSASSTPYVQGLVLLYITDMLLSCLHYQQLQARVIFTTPNTTRWNRLPV